MLLKNDCEKGEGVDLAREYEVRVYPTFAMVDQSGEVTDRWAGYGGVQAFIAQLDAALADRSTIAEKKQRYQEQPTLPLALSLAQYSEAVFANAEAVDYYRTIIAMEPEREVETRRKIFLSMFYGLRDEQFTVEELLAEGRTLLADSALEPVELLQVATVVKRAAPPVAYVPFLERALAATASAAAAESDGAEAEFIAEQRRQLLIDEALLIQRDRPLALELRRELLPADWRQDATEMHRFVRWCLEQNLNLEEASALALAAADLAADDGSRASVLATAASLAFRRGDLARAVALQEQAIALAPARDRYRQQLAQLETARDQQPGEIIESRTGTAYPDRLVIGDGEHTATLQATGTGVRRRTLMKVEVYTIASYVSAGLDLTDLADQPGGPAEALRTLDLPKRIQMDLRRGFGRERLVGSFADVIARNYRDTSAFRDDLAVFLGYFDRDAEKGDRIVFDYLPGTGLITTVNDEVKGTIAGSALKEALWTVWFGETPADRGLQRELLDGV